MNQEQERLKLLRERQLADRDPNVKQQQFQRLSAKRERTRDKSYSIGRMWGDIPHVWKGFFYGLLLGTLVLLVFPFIWASHLIIPISLIVIVFLSIFGALVGRAVDARAEIKKLMR